MPHDFEARRRDLGGGAGVEAQRVTASTSHAPALERMAYWSLLACAAATQFSIAAAQILLALTGLLWLALLVTGRERIEVPSMFWPLAVYAGVTLIASMFSIDPRVSFWDSRQL